METHLDNICINVNKELIYNGILTDISHHLPIRHFLLIKTQD